MKFILPSQHKAPRAEDRSTSRRRVPNYSSRREQYRLMVLVCSLMLVLVLMNEARKPQNWSWLWSRQGPRPEPQLTGLHATAAVSGTPVPVAAGEIDTRVETGPGGKRRSALPHDGFVARAADAWDDGADQGQRTEPIPLAANQPQSSDLFPGVTPAMLADVKDDAVFRPQEAKGWYQLWGILQTTSTAQIDAASLGSVGFVQLYRQTAELRGKVVTVEGRVRRAQRIRARENQSEVSEYWQCWLQPLSGNSPMVIYAIALPDGFPEGEQIDEFVSASGICYKRWAYLAQDGTRVAPLILAKTLSWHRPVANPAASRNLPPWLPLTVVSMLAVAAVLASFAYRSAKHRPAAAARQRHLQDRGPAE